MSDAKVNPEIIKEAERLSHEIKNDYEIAVKMDLSQSTVSRIRRSGFDYDKYKELSAEYFSDKRKFTPMCIHCKKVHFRNLELERKLKKLSNLHGHNRIRTN